MRSNCFKGIFLTLLTSLLTACVETASAQPAQLVTLNAGWKYNESGANLGTAWRASAYDDTVAGWEGPSNILFGFETTPAEYNPLTFKTQFADPKTQTPFRTNYYFRTHFTLPSMSAADFAHTTLISTNAVDDGAVYYINGSEWFRFNMPAGTVSATTFASPTLTEGWPPTGATVFFRTNSATNLVAGDNVLAVEVHQADATSSDEVFGMSLSAIYPTPIVITQQPVDQTVALGTTFTNTIVVTGYNPAYQWYTNGVKVPGQTASTFRIASATTNANGNYFCVVTNYKGAVTSDVFQVSVVVDTFPPFMVSALASDAGGVGVASNAVLVTFNKNMLVGVTNNPNTNVVNYVINIYGTTNRMVVTNVTLSGRLVRLICNQGFIFGTNYVLTVNNLADTKTNIIVPNSMIGIGMAPDNPINIFAYYQSWRENESSLDLGTAWRGVNYNEDTVNHTTDGYWGGASSGVFAYDTGGNITLCNGYVINSSVSGPFGIQTFYFRTYFQMPSNTPTAGTLVFNLFNDDGVIYYLNGVEVYRNNMPSGAVTYNTTASSMRNPSCISASVAVTNLFAYPRTNVMAAELHQSGSGSDFVVCFGLDLDFSYIQYSPLPPQLKIAGKSPRNITWTNKIAGVNWGLQYTTNLTKTGTIWTDLPNSSPYPDSSTGPRRFFRTTVK